MINNIYELVLGIFFGILFFFIGFFSLVSTSSIDNPYIKNNTLNLILIGFFIIIFFLFGYLLNNIFQTFRTSKKKE